MPETRYCPHCGASVTQQDTFCGACGKRIHQQAVTEASTPGHERSASVQEPTPPAHEPTAAAADPESTQQTVTAVAGPSRPAGRSDGGRPQAFDIAKLDRTAIVAGLCGLVAFIASFQPWYQVSVSGITLFSDNAWNAGLISWLPVLLLVAIGVWALLPAFGQRAPAPIVTTGVGLACTGLLIIRLATFPTYSSSDLGGGGDFGVSEGGGAGIYIALLIAVIVTVLGLLTGGAAAVSQRVAKIKERQRSGPPPPKGS